MLLQNKTVNAQYPLRLSCGTTADSRSLFADRLQSYRNRYVSEASMNSKYSTPNGYTPGTTWLPNVVSGGMALFRGLSGDGTIVSVNLAGGKNGASTISGSGSIVTALGALIVSAVSTITASGSITADIAGKLEAVASLAGSGDLTGALGSLASLLANLTGAGTVDDAGITAIGDMSADLLPFTELSPQSLANAVWNSNHAEYVDLNTFGGATAFLYLLAHNKVITNPATGTMDIYDSDGVTVLFTADLFEDASGSSPYDGQGAERREQFDPPI